MADATIEYLLRIRDEASQALKDLGDEAGEAESKLQGADKGTQSMTASMVKATAVIGAAKMAFGALKTAFTEVGINSVKVGAQMESYETKLTVLTGSADVAKARLEELFRIGSTTPFELDSLIEAEVNLRALGVNAEETLPMVMDFAGAMGVDVASAAVEVGRAMQFGAGAVETISGRALRAQVELRTGQDALKMSTEEFRTELIKTLTDSEGIFAGGTEKLAATFTGMVSNLSDAWFKFQKEVSQAKLFVGAKDTLKLILDLLAQNADTTSLWAKVIGESLIAGLLLTAEALSKVASFMASMTATAIESVQGYLRVLAEVPTQRANAIQMNNSLLDWKAAIEGAGKALIQFDDKIDDIQEKLENLPDIKIKTDVEDPGGRGGGDGGTPITGGVLRVETVKLETQAFRGGAQPEGTLAQFQQTQFVAALGEALSGLGGVLSNALSSARSLAGGSLPGMFWWGQAINFLAEFADPIDWGKLEQTIHDAFVGAVRLFFDLDAIFGAIVDGVVFGIQDAFSLAREGGAEPTGGEAISGLISRINETLGAEGRSFQTGTKFVDQTGLALLHRGERVVPANGATPSNMQGFGGGGGLVVNVNAPLGIGPGTAEQLVRELNSILGARGLNLAVT